MFIIHGDHLHGLHVSYLVISTKLHAIAVILFMPATLKWCLFEFMLGFIKVQAQLGRGAFDYDFFHGLLLHIMDK